ncbi:hypothetical protein H4R99_007924 [Coemansia sp. RSA 1722]|nr:hypothetical protein LPJ57_003836 [Coemansia sp. RSA 486]KAJ2226010.1 hypothetical protein IWW45_007641 [Coemansia sp. RSA 485]KAJ2588104.1 hypothetical protein H4R99_007924 [Coemansia sp. RSA 1722]
MRYNSPTFQLALVATTLLLTTTVRRLLDNYLLQQAPSDVNLAYEKHLPTSIVACVSGFVGIPLVNLIGLRHIFMFYSLTNIVYASSVVVSYQYRSSVFQGVALLINVVGYDIGRVATLVVVLAYPGERWKARALGAFLILEYLSATMGDVIALQNHDPEEKRFPGAVAYLATACLAPFVAMTIAPSHRVVREDGVYLLTLPTDIKHEIKETAKLFGNKYMLLLIPYMFSYPFLFGAGSFDLGSPLSFITYDVGKILVILMGQMLDVQWAGRRARGTCALAVVVAVYLLAFALTTETREHKYDFSGLDAGWPREKSIEYIRTQVLRQQYSVLLGVSFLSGMVSGMIELFGYWVMGTLTNDLNSSARFVGTYHGFMALGGLAGFQLSENVHDGLYPSRIPYYLAAALTLASLLLSYFVVRRISETNDWTLGMIAIDHQSCGSQSPDNASEPVAAAADVKYRHFRSQEQEA